MDYSQFLNMREELSLIAVLLLLFLADLFMSPDAHKNGGKARLNTMLPVILMAIHTAINLIPGTATDAFGGMYHYVPMHTVVKSILNVGTLIVFLMAHEWMKREDTSFKQGEFYVLTLSTLFGMYLMISAGHFLMFFIGLETASIPMAALIAFDKYRHNSAEAGAKYILTALFSSALLLFGLSMIYGSAGTLYFDDLPAHIDGNPLQIMAFVFFLTFTVGDWMKGYFEIALEVFSNLVSNGLAAVHTSPMLTSLIVDGIISGVGGILTFLPNIFILFLALALLEDSGYMSRVAFVMDDIMSSLGLSGRAFLPLLLGFGCTVPAVMASRALENKRDRFKTILITPFMSCSARLPIYVLFSSMFFGKYAMIVCYSMYLLGIIIAITTAFILSKIDGSKATHALLIELPEYKTPSAHTIAIYVWQKIKDYLTKAGTVIFIASILMWAILNFGPHGYVTDISESFGSVIGRLIVPVFQPVGLGYWQIIVALIAGIAAKEVVVSSCSVLFGIQNITTAHGMTAMVASLGAIGFGPANAYALMTFCLLYVPCTATIATIHRELQSWKSTGFILLYQLCTAWIISFVVYHIASLF